jgi:uncharacterized membrane protein
MFDTSHLHPMIVHFPVALAVVGLFFEVIFYRKGNEKPVCGEYILYLAALSAIVALLTGLFFTSSLSGEALVMKDKHQLSAILSTVFLFLTSMIYLYRRISKTEKLKEAGIVLYFVSFVLISITGFLGGNLVYSYMIGL